MHQIKVVNDNKITLSDRYDGIAYHFAPGENKSIPLEVAQHIFGVDFPADEKQCASPELRDEVFQHLSRRWGWNIQGKNKLEVGEVMMKKLTFIPVETKTVELTVKSNELPQPRGDKEDAEDAA